MPDPRTVWLARPGRERPVRGTLSLSERGLTLDSNGAILEIDPAHVERVRRMRLTPVLEVRYRARGEQQVALFFFVEPPPLPGQPPDPAARGTWPWSSEGRGMRRTAGMRRLRAANRALRRVIAEWVQAIRERTPG